MEYIEFADMYVIRRMCYYKRLKSSEFEVELHEGVFALFAETKGRKKKKYELVELAFDKEKYSLIDVEDYWRDWDIRYTDTNHTNKKYPQIEYFINAPGGYVFGMYRNAGEFTEKEFFKKQYEEAVRSQQEGEA